MKNIFKYMAGLLFAGVAMTACSPDEFEGAKGNIPQVSDFADNFKVSVDQETNYAYFEFISAPKVTPVWILDGTAYSSAYSFSKYYRKKGEYTVECKVKNADGLSDGVVTKAFTIDKTIISGFGGFVEDSDFNLFKGVTFNVASFWYAPGWAQIDDPKYTYQNGAFVVTLPAATTDQWQAQMHVELDKAIALTADKAYDFSIIVTSTTKHPGVTVKLQQKGDDNKLISEQRVALDANEPKCIWFSNVQGVDITDLKFAFDFGGNEANTEIILESFVLKDHANDDGTVVPEVEVPEPKWVAVDSDENLWKGVEYTMWYYYAHGDAWETYPTNPEMAVDGTTYTFTFPEPSDLPWQAQCHFQTSNLSTSAANEYDMSFNITSTTNLPAVTIKLCANDGNETDDNVIIVSETIALEANTPVHFWKAQQPGQEIGKAKLVLDFGGNPAGTKVEIKDMILQVHK